MKKLILTTSVMFIAVSVMAQKDYAKKVKSNYISLPAYNVSEVDHATVSIEFAMKDGEFGTEKLKDAQSTCVPSGGTIKDAIKVTSYYFEIPYTKPESYIIAKSTDGTMVYANKASNTESDNLKFGWDPKMKQPLCEYYKSDKLKKDYKSKGADFKTKSHSNYQKFIYEKALQEAKENVYLSYFTEEFKVYSGKGKAYDYVDLDAAFDKAIIAYKSISKNGLNSKDLAKLKETITVWEKELETLDIEDKKARISKSIGKGLHENCVKAYVYMLDFENAKSHAKSFLKLYGNYSDNRSTAMKGLLVKIQLQAMAAESNTAILSDIEKLHTMASAASKKVNSKILASSEFDRLATEYSVHNMNVAIEVNEQHKEDEAAAIASGELNPYQKFYSTVAAGGPAMLMNMAPSALSGIPVLTEFPKEILEFTDLKQIVIISNSLESITPDIAKLTSLKKLDFSGNNLKTLPVEIGQLTNLKTLRLNKNPLESIPAEIANCKNLTSLVIKGTNLSDEAIAELTKLLPNCKIKY
jgi:Leucine-rich repeat (LRR) protein